MKTERIANFRTKLIMRGIKYPLSENYVSFYGYETRTALSLERETQTTRIRFCDT